MGAQQRLEVEVAGVVDQHRVAGPQQEAADQVDRLRPRRGEQDLIRAGLDPLRRRTGGRAVGAGRAIRACCRSRRAPRRRPWQRPRMARRMAAFGIQSAGSQPQPGLSISAPASSDCRDTQKGSIARSSRGSTSASASGGSGAGDVEAGARPGRGSRPRPRAGHRPRPRSTATRAWSRRSCGSRAASRRRVSARLAIRRRIASITLPSVRGRRRRHARRLISVQAYGSSNHTVRSNCIGLSLSAASPRSR